VANKRIIARIHTHFASLKKNNYVSKNTDNLLAKGNVAADRLAALGCGATSPSRFSSNSLPPPTQQCCTTPNLALHVVLGPRSSALHLLRARLSPHRPRLPPFDIRLPSLWRAFFLCLATCVFVLLVPATRYEGILWGPSWRLEVVSERICLIGSLY